MTEEQAKRFSEALTRLSGDEDLLVAMAMMVVDDAPVIVEKLDQQVDQESLADVATTAHKLKGMCSTFETGSPVVELEEVIHAARTGKADEARATYHSCQPLIHRLLGEIAELTH